MSRFSAFGLFFVIVCVAVVVNPSVAGDQWIDLGSATVPGTSPTVGVHDVEGGVSLVVDLAGFYIEERATVRGSMAVVEVPGFGNRGVIGEPSLPFKTVLIPLAHGLSAQLSILETDSGTAVSEVVVMPQQEPEPDCGDISTEFAMDNKAYAADRWFPDEPARIIDDVVVRGQRFLLVEVSPLAFNPARGEISALSNLRVNVDFSGEVDEAAEARKAARHSVFFPTAAEIEGPPAPETIPTGIEYLIIADDALAAAFEPLAEWKRKKGMTVEIVLMSTIGTTSDDLKSYLQARYDADSDLTYVLLGGDYPAIPSESFSHPYSGTYVTDLWFSCLDGTDYFPDIVMSRIAVQSLTDCQNVVSKILAWDRDPVPGVWHGDYLMAAYLQGGCTAERYFFETGTHAMHFIEDTVGMGTHTAATSDSLSCNPYYWRPDQPYYNHRPPGYAGQAVPQADADLITSASTSTQDITDAINTGVSLVQHRDHGGETGWGDPPYNNSHVNALSNGAMTPIVYSINCLTGKFNMSGDSFAEAFMKKYPGGAVGVMAATQVSYSGHNDLLVHGAYDSFWDGYDTDDGGNVYPHSLRPAEAYLYGKYYMYNWQGDGSTTELEFGLFHWHGDPEMRAFTATPTAPSVSVDPTLPAGSPTMTVVADVENALVSVTDGGTLLGRGFVTGGAVVVDLDPPPAEPTTVDVVVSGHNLVPWQGTVEVIVPNGPWMTHRSHLCDDSAGNNDGIANPGETITLPLTVENIGAEDGTGLAGVLGSGSAHVTVADALTSFPDAVVGAQVQSLPNHVSVTVSPTAPSGHVANLSLDWSASGGFTGTSYFALPVCELLLIDNVTTSFVGNDSAVVSWTTNVPATTRLTYGLQTPDTILDGSGTPTGHEVLIEGLDPCTSYVFEVTSTSPDCYTSVDDNGGANHRFFTTAGTPVVDVATDTPVSIPDSNTTGASSSITVASDFEVVDVDLLVNITHTYTGDLELFLLAPDGTSVMLSDQHGSSGNNYTDTVFDDEAAAPISGGSAPFTGTFQPDEPLASLNGQPAAGVWTFKVVDRLGGDLGTIDDWELRLKVNEPCDSIFVDDFEIGHAGAWSNVMP